MAVERARERIEDAFIDQIVKCLSGVERHDQIETSFQRGVHQQRQLFRRERGPIESEVRSKNGACARAQAAG